MKVFLIPLLPQASQNGPPQQPDNFPSNFTEETQAIRKKFHRLSTIKFKNLPSLTLIVSSFILCQQKIYLLLFSI